MLVPLSNTPRDYDWGSTSLLADMEGRESSGRHEAEIWFGDHPGSPAATADGRTLDVWLREDGARQGAPDRLPYLMKVLAAASSLSIQAHPSKEHAVAAFAREEAGGPPRDAPDRNYRDDNHKPELIVAVSETFTALAGLRDLDDTRRLLAILAPAGERLAARLAGPDAAATLAGAIGWLLSGEAAPDIDAIVAAASAAESDEFAGELALIGRLATEFPGDPGIGVALLMNLVTLRRGEGLFVPAGVLHAYQDGLGVELMAASDNVLRGGLTPKHVDVRELLAVLDASPGPVPVLRPAVVDGVARFAVDVPDFALAHAVVLDGVEVTVPVAGVAIALVTTGSVTVTGSSAGESVDLVPGQAVLVTPDEALLHLSGHGELFVAQPGEGSSAVSAS